LQIEFARGTGDRSYLHVAGVGEGPEHALKLLEGACNSLHATQQTKLNSTDNTRVHNSSKAASLTSKDDGAYSVTATAAKGTAISNTLTLSHSRSGAVPKGVAHDSKACTSYCSKKNDSNDGSADASDMSSAVAQGAAPSRLAATNTTATTAVITSTQKAANKAGTRSEGKQLLSMNTANVPKLDIPATVTQYSDSSMVVNAGSSTHARAQGAGGTTYSRKVLQQQQQLLQQQQQRRPVCQQWGDSLWHALPYTDDSTHDCVIRAQQQQQYNGASGYRETVQNGTTYYTLPAPVQTRQQPPQRRQQQQQWQQDQHNTDNGSGNAGMTRNGLTYYAMPSAVQMQQRSIDSDIGVLIWNGMAYYPLPPAVQMLQQPMVVVCNANNMPISGQYILPLVHIPPSL
jgi:hypothetical protein